MLVVQDCFGSFLVPRYQQPFISSKTPQRHQPTNPREEDHVKSKFASTSISSSSLAAATTTVQDIEFQSDTSKYGRGDMHLSAALDIGDIVVYQGGTWWVDGVAVGDTDSTPTFHYAVVDTIQVVWTHNCEHGVIRGLPLVMSSPEDDATTVLKLESEEGIEFGPEQLLAKLPLLWNEEAGIVASPFPLNDELWISADEEDNNQ